MGCVRKWGGHSADAACVRCCYALGAFWALPPVGRNASSRLCEWRPSGHACDVDHVGCTQRGQGIHFIPIWSESHQLSLAGALGSRGGGGAATGSQLGRDLPRGNSVSRETARSQCSATAFAKRGTRQSTCYAECNAENGWVLQLQTAFANSGRGCLQLRPRAAEQPAEPPEICEILRQ